MKLAINGFEDLKFGSEINEKYTNLFSPIINCPYYSKLRPDYEEEFDYYYTEDVKCQYNTNTFYLKHIFIGLNKKTRLIDGFTIFVDKKYGETLIENLNFLYSSQKLVSNTAILNKTIRENKFWQKDGVSLFLINNYSENKLKLILINATPEIKSPTINISDLDKEYRTQIDE